MERSTQKYGLINFLTLLVLGAAAFAVARVTPSIAGYVTCAFIGIGVLVSVVSWFQMRLEETERLEKLDLDEMIQGRSGSALFEAKEAEVFPAQRSREQFERFFIPIFTALLFIAEAAAAYVIWRDLGKVDAFVEVKQPLVALALFGLFALIFFLLGKFSATMARLENHRLLRASASWLLLNAYLCFLVAIGVAAVEAGFPRADLYVARAVCVLLGLLALETLINLVLEIYRPRVKGKIARPLYESRLVGLLGHPEGLITTAAQALDYQFGFKVSETWFYRFFERHLASLLLLQLGVLLLSTCVVFIDPGEQGLLERFGKPVANRTLLDAGGHLKWPWPIDRVHRYRTEQIQSFNVGFVPDADSDKQPVVLWTVAHTKEENFLVATRESTITATTTNVSGRAAPPVSLLTVSIPVQFQITNLPVWVYRNSDPASLLQSLATREVVRYLVNADINEVMSRQRLEAAEALRQRIQEVANERKLGANIVFVGLQDIHPPVKVAADYEKVVGAAQTRMGKILAAQADDIKTNALAAAAATNIINRALADRTTRTINALAQASLFTNQLPAFQAAPAVYAQRRYLETFARATAKSRKFVLLSTNTADVVQLDLQDKMPDPLLDLSVTPER